MTPREVQLHIRAASENRFDRYDELVAAAWQGALWSQIGPKRMPKLDKVLATRPRRKRKRTFEEEIRRWEIFFGAVKDRAN